MSFSMNRLVLTAVSVVIGAASLAAFAVERQFWMLIGAVPLLLVPALLYEWAVTRDDE
jgi:hypothetical protein